ncbi:class II fructose-bisphosphate aldolase [Candidatus Woesearchaeota archaeon]|nr:class II fructose-bisphosphate aldolase [Candidatus Woesearchaeota archaeon]
MSKPISGKKIFKALCDEPTIILACNTRVTKGTVKGILRAAKDTDSPVIIELAKSECNLDVGYTGYTPETFSKAVKKIAKEVGHDIWALHADHITIKKGTDQEIEETKKLIKSQIESGFTSFAIDASHLFNTNADNEKEQLKENIRVTTELAKYIEKEIKSKEFGLEVEVGEVGKKDDQGMVITTPKEALTFITELINNGIDPDVLAIANGSSHGNIYDQAGNLIEQVSIDIARTKEIVDVLRQKGFCVRIAQHGITGTPIDLIYKKFPHGDIIKGNVGTYWQNIYFDVLKVHNPQLYDKIWKWVINKYKGSGKTELEIFGKRAKYAHKEFFEEIYAMDKDMEKNLELMAYSHALLFLKAFKSHGYAAHVRKIL